MRRLFIILCAMVLGVSMVMAQDEAATGTLEFRANGEDFVREGFTSKDGWNINFDHVYVALSKVRAHQTNPPYDPFAGELTRSVQMIGLPGQFVVDLAEGDENAETILVETVEAAPEGFYNAVEWLVLPAESGDFAGQSIVMQGTAEREGETVEFTIRIDEDYAYTCGAFVGDERKGVLAADATGEVEMTFHFDHIFGDAGAPMDDAINVTAPGFDPFAAIAMDGMLDVSLSDMAESMDEDDYQMFVDILPSLGHTGEGHCFEKNLGD